MADERRSKRGGAEAGPYASDARVRRQSTWTHWPSMAAQVDVGGRGEELARPGTRTGAEVAGSGMSDLVSPFVAPCGVQAAAAMKLIVGMSDLVSPFVVLYEDDADAFWCFEMLLRRMHENFHLKGPTGVMKRLEALWKIMELTDREVINW
ncbi:TBC1 domain family member 15 [Triticum urartu]|uniref:TBC1 domain family member 15 n=2 Tax=Triticum urartu TaxID=4572 RepID=M7Z4G7_TRIUA|nr:TBC1 domain family member 15 [Triticum urartu]